MLLIHPPVTQLSVEKFANLLQCYEMEAFAVQDIAFFYVFLSLLILSSFVHNFVMPILKCAI